MPTSRDAGTASARLSASTAPSMDFETRAIHAGQEPDPATGAIITPIYQTSTYVQEAVGVNKGYDYSRVANPTRTALAGCAREPRERRARRRVQLRSRRDDDADAPRRPRRARRADRRRLRRRLPDDVAGLRAEGLQVHVRPGERVRREPLVAPRRRREDGVDRDAVEPAAEHRRHPQGCGRGARGRRAARRRQHLRDAVPAAAARPRRRRGRPLDDEVPRRPQRHDRRLRRHERRRARRAPLLPAEVARRRARARSTPGSCCAGSRRSPCACASTARTRARSPSSSTAIPAVERVLYPGLPNHPGHDVARAQMRDFGGMVSFLVESERRRSTLVARTKLFQLAESLGGVESLIEHPARMTHASTAGAPFAPPRQPRSPLGRDRVGRRPDRRSRGRARRRSTPARA